MAFSVGYVVVYFVFSVGADFMEKFEKQAGAELGQAQLKLGLELNSI